MCCCGCFTRKIAIVKYDRIFTSTFESIGQVVLDRLDKDLFRSVILEIQKKKKIILMVTQKYINATEYEP